MSHIYLKIEIKDHISNRWMYFLCSKARWSGRYSSGSLTPSLLFALFDVCLEQQLLDNDFQMLDKDLALNSRWYWRYPATRASTLSIWTLSLPPPHLQRRQLFDFCFLEKNRKYFEKSWAKKIKFTQNAKNDDKTWDFWRCFLARAARQKFLPYSK